MPSVSDDKLPLYIDSENPDEYLNIKETDPIFSTTFEMMIKQAFRADKHFILAKILTRA